MTVCCLFLFLRDRSIILLLKISREMEYQQALKRYKSPRDSSTFSLQGEGVVVNPWVLFSPTKKAFHPIGETR